MAEDTERRTDNEPTKGQRRTQDSEDFVSLFGPKARIHAERNYIHFMLDSK